MLTIKTLKQNLLDGVYDAKLARVYCKDIKNLQSVHDRICRVADSWMKEFGKNADDAVAIFSAPGRTEIGGNHTDHQRGKVLAGSVDMDALACAAPNGTDMVNIFSEGYGLISVNCRENEARKEEENTTVALIRGIVSEIAKKGYPVKGFDAFVTSDVPGGSGLSSSACFEVLIGVIVNDLFCGNNLRPDEIAKIGQIAENVYFGKPSGLLDQMGCAIGGIVTIDFSSVDTPFFRVVTYDFAKAGYALCIIDTGADHADLTGDYAAVPAEMKAVAAYFGKEVLVEVDEKDFYRELGKIREITGDRAVLRAVHYYNDCRRVVKQVEALENNDFDTFLKLVKESGQSSFMYLQNIDTFRKTEKEPVAVALAVAEHLLQGKGAFRVHGGGFAGTIQAYVPLDMTDAFKAGMDALLGEGACRITSIRPVGGITLIEE